jgi:tRNA dimethylallyltransferase
MDLGTGKDLADYTFKGGAVAYHLIDIAEAGYRYNVYEYQRDFLMAYHEIRERGRLPVMCGGTGMYIEAVLKGYRLEAAPENPDLRSDLEGRSLEELRGILGTYRRGGDEGGVDTARRAIRAIEVEAYYAERERSQREFPSLRSLIIGIDIDREARRRRISERLRQRLEEGMIEEVKGLLEGGVKPEDLIYYGLEYKYLTLYVTGRLAYEDMFCQLETAIHQFAKRQMTWFRGMERKGFVIHWVRDLEDARKLLEGGS